jgi:HSP20 family protein
MMLFDTFKELDRISSTFFSGFPEPALSAAPVNLYRNDDRYVMEVDLPGFEPSSVDVTAEPGLLTIRADRDTSREDRNDRWLIRERDSARVVRQIALGDDVDVDAIAADYQNGVLRVTLPVRADALPRKVAVAVGSPSSAPQAIESGEAAQRDAHPKAEPAHSVAS